MPGRQGKQASSPQGRPVKTKGADEKARPPESSLAIRCSHRVCLPRVRASATTDRACDSVAGLLPHSGDKLPRSGDNLEGLGQGRGEGRKPANTTGEVKKSKAIVLIYPLITVMKDGERRPGEGTEKSTGFKVSARASQLHFCFGRINPKTVPTLWKLKDSLISTYFVAFYRSGDEFYVHIQATLHLVIALK